MLFNFQEKALNNSSYYYNRLCLVLRLKGAQNVFLRHVIYEALDDSSERPLKAEPTTHDL